MYGSRVTDVVSFFGRRGEQRSAVREVRVRTPDRFRWRSAVGYLTRSAGTLRGLDRMRIEEPVREVVIELPELLLQQEVVLDARRNNVDLDRGELLPRHRVGDLRRMAFLVGANMDLISRFVRLPNDFEAPIDTAGVTVVSRAYADMHRRRAQDLVLQTPDDDSLLLSSRQWRDTREQIEREADLARRWTALSKALLVES